MAGAFDVNVDSDFLQLPASRKDKTMADFPYRPECVGDCGQPATYRRACGHFYCETCTDLCVPITHRFDRRTNSWVPVTGDPEDEVYNVSITVKGKNKEEVYRVEAAIDDMMHDLYEVFRVERGN